MSCRDRKEKVVLQFARIVLTMSANQVSICWSQAVENLSSHLTHVVQLAGAGVHSLEQLIDLIIAHLLAKVRKDVAELAHANKSCELFVEYLEATAVLFGLARVAESTGAVEHALEVVKVDCRIAESASPQLVAYALIVWVVSYSRLPSGSRGP